jgi:putative SOS response-associated peptidase YedK
MPVIIQPDAYGRWLAADTPSTEFRRLTTEFSAESMRAWEIGLLVNDPKTDDSRVIAPVD